MYLGVVELYFEGVGPYSLRPTPNKVIMTLTCHSNLDIIPKPTKSRCSDN